MPTLYYTPESRATRIIVQLMMMGKLDEIKVVNVAVVKADGSGHADSNNPHPEGKVPYLITDDGEQIRESAAIMMYLDELYGSGLSILAGQKGRGAFLSWMTYYCGVLEPAMVAHFAQIDHPMIVTSVRTMKEVGEHITSGLADKPFLLGDKITVADLIMASAFQWAPHLTPDYDNVKAWLKRVSDAINGEALQAYEARAKDALMAA